MVQSTCYILCDGKLCNFISLVTNLRTLPSNTQEYLREQLEFIFLRNKQRARYWTIRHLKLLWDTNISMFINYINLYDITVLYTFRRFCYRRIQYYLAGYEKALPKVLDVVKNPQKYYQRLWDYISYDYGWKMIVSLATPDTCEYVDNKGRNALMRCLDKFNFQAYVTAIDRTTSKNYRYMIRYMITPKTIRQIDNDGCNALLICLSGYKTPEWIPLVKRMITMETITQVNNFGTTPLVKAFLNVTDPAWIPIIQQLLTPETKKQMRKHKLNLLIMSLFIPKDPAWIPLVEKLITPKTIKQRHKDGTNALMTALDNCLDPAWIPLVEKLITPKTIKHRDDFGDNALMIALRNCQDPAWIPLVEKLITPKSVQAAGSSYLIKEIKKHTNSQWHALIELIEKAS